jgi:hypothetical protein
MLLSSDGIHPKLETYSVFSGAFADIKIEMGTK